MINNAYVEVLCDNTDCYSDVMVELDYVYSDYSGKNGRYDDSDVAVERSLEQDHDWIVKGGKHFCCEDCASI